MSGFIRRTAARALDLTGYLSQSSSPLPDDDSAPPRGDTAVPGRSDAPPVLAAGVQSASEASPAAPVASPIISHAFTTQSALLGVSEEALRDTVDEVATAASDRNLTMSATQLAPVTKFLSRKSAPPSLLTLSTSGDVGKLRARLDLTYAGRQALEVQLLTHIGLRENAELFARQATAEIEELQTELKRGKDSDAAHLRRFMDAQGSLDASTETTVKLRQFIKSIQESNLSIQKQVQREREVFKAKVVANAKQTSKLHRLLSDLIKGDSSDGQALLSKVAVQRDRINRLTRANGILRQQVDLRAMDAVTLVLAIEIDARRSRSAPAIGRMSTPLEVNIAKAVHHAKKPGRRRRLRRAGSSSESSPSPSSDSEDSKRPHRKPSGSRGRSWHRQRSESFKASRSAYAQGLEEGQAGQEASCGVGSDLRFLPRIAPRSRRQIHGFGIRRQLPLLHRALRRRRSSPVLQRLRLEHRSQ
ncbi:hypothetical protein PC118_g999 [Phytophthora cactorum]|uniref:Uncharacterized protein n=2 Tax=Phytophthora cactorum TaxID=29920 RepID=A0A8T1GQC1_9STRA|nr:hypothetical protein PC118_g999 [Phytophthora cactorum]